MAGTSDKQTLVLWSVLGFSLSVLNTGCYSLHVIFVLELVQEVQGCTWEGQSLWRRRGWGGGRVERWKSGKLNIWMKWIELAFETLLYSKWTSWYLVLWIVNIHITQNYLAFTESFLIINLGSNAKEHVSGFVWPQILPFSLWADDMPSLRTDIGC